VTDRVQLPAALGELSARVAAPFAARGLELYLVGGVVRDLLLRAPAPSDLDFATSGTPAETRSALAAAGADAVYDVGERFGTIGGIFGGRRVEITTYRTEAYAAGSRKPSVVFRGSLIEDLARRDFTINAMAAAPGSGEIVDPFGGRADLARGVVRGVGEPRERFREDPLRLLRAVRFASRLAFELDSATDAALRATGDALATISRERVRDELDKILLGPSPAAGMRLLCESGLARCSVPELLELLGMRQETGRHKDVFSHTLQVLERTPPRLPLRWAALLHDIAKPRTLSVEANGDVHFFGHDSVGARMARRLLSDLHHASELVDRAGRLVALHLRANAYDGTWSDGAVRRFVLEAGDDLVEDLLALSRADVTSGRAERRLAVARGVSALEARIADLRAQADIARLSSPIDGNDLMALFGRPPGPWIRPIKDHLRDLVLDGDLAQDDRGAAETIARQLYAELFPAESRTRAGETRSGPST